MITIALCLSDIPKDRIKAGANGKKYINLILSERKSVSERGETHTLSISKSKEEREAKAATIYVGGGTEYKPAPTLAPTPEQIEAMPPYIPEEDNDLPF